jgi:alkylated DNA repair dioxygenase AlkB
MDEQLPGGFHYIPEFLTEDEEAALLGIIVSLDFREFAIRGVTAKRRVAHFGWHYSFESYRLTPAPAPPEAFDSIRVRAAGIANIDPAELSEVLVTEYQAGAGIGWHRDAPPFGIVAGVSFAGNCRMRFQTGKAGDRRTASIQLARRSLYLLTGEARTKWQHTIPPTKELRCSITFRTLRHPR